jgi:hypothetical protein
MGCLRRILMICVVLLLTVSALLSLLVLGSAGVLGEAALIAADDAIVLIILSLIAIVVLILILWQESRTRSRLEKTVAELEQRGRLIAQPIKNLNVSNDVSTISGAGLSPSLASSGPQYCRNCGTSLAGTLNFCPECGVGVVRAS